MTQKAYNLPDLLTLEDTHDQHDLLIIDSTSRQHRPLNMPPITTWVRVSDFDYKDSANDSNTDCNTDCNTDADTDTDYDTHSDTDPDSDFCPHSILRYVSDRVPPDKQGDSVPNHSDIRYDHDLFRSQPG
jgi:hypothetical protein